MIKVNLKYPSGATYTTETATVVDLIAALKGISEDRPVFLQYSGRQGKIPVKILGVVDDPDISTGPSFIIESVVDLD